MGLLDFISKLKGTSGDERDERKGRHRGARDEMLDTIGQIIKLCRPAAVRDSSYRKKLAPAVERALAYADDLVARIPGPVEIKSDSWAKDPLVNTLFASVDQFRDFFSRDRELEKFHKKVGDRPCYALLTMKRVEKTILVAEKQGEIVKRDVPKTAVNFDDHRIVAPAESERRTKTELSKRTVSLLTDMVCNEILELKKWKSELETEKRILEARIEFREAGKRDVESLLSDAGAEEGGRMAEARDVLGQLDRKIAEVESELPAPADYLAEVENVLTHPEKYIKANLVRMRIGDLGMKITNPNDQRGEEIRFSELSLHNGLKRAAVLVRLSKF